MIIDEFYKLSGSRDDERSSSLNNAFYKLYWKFKPQFYLLGPNIDGVSNGFLEYYNAIFYHSDCSLVDSRVIDIYRDYPDQIGTRGKKRDFTEKLLEKICFEVNGSYEAKIGDNTINFKAPYKRISILDSIKEKTGYDLEGKSEEEIREVCKALKLDVDASMGKGKLIDEIFGEFCEGTYIQPTFIIDYPVEMSPLTKAHRSKPGLTERFELMVNGKELANAYSELNDPIDQYERFQEQLRLSQKGDDEAMFIDQDFVRALEYGMPPTSGIGIGIDRLTMLLTGQQAIQEVLFFPQMKPETNN